MSVMESFSDTGPNTNFDSSFLPGEGMSKIKQPALEPNQAAAGRG